MWSLTYVGHRYFNAFCTHIRKPLGNKVNFAFSSPYSIDPQFKTEDKVSTKPAVIPYDTSKLEEEPLHKWYYPTVNNSGAAKFNSKNAIPTPITKVTWAESNKPPANTSSEKIEYFQLGMDLSYCDGTGENVITV